MIDRRKFVSLGFAALALAALPVAAFPVTAVAKSQKNVSYGPNRLDIYAPANANAPVIVYVHGGAWRAGSKGEASGIARHFNDLGYMVVGVAYSLSRSADRQADEVGAAVRWVQANIAGFGGDPARIALMGHSAGAHLSALAALSGRAPGVRALVTNDTGAYDLAYLAQIHNGRLPILYAALNDRAKWDVWSPITYAGGGGMPVLVAWSGAEFRHKVANRFADALETSGHVVTRFDGSGYNHLSIRGAASRNGDPLNRAIAAFLAANL